MPRITRRTAAQAEIASPALTAATTPVDVRSQSRSRKISASKWAKQAWDFYDSVGELRYVCGWLSNSLSRVSLVASDVNPMTGQPTGETEDESVAGIVADIAGGPAGQSQMLGRLATFLTVPGEGWVAVLARQDDDGRQYEEWHVIAADEMTHRGTDLLLQLEDGTDHAFDPDADILTRVHRPHPRSARDADSPVRAALPILMEITRMSQAIEGAGKSRLAGNGILLLPQEISMPMAEPPKADPDAPGLTSSEPTIVDQPVSANDVMQQLQQVMTTAIADRTSAAAMVPIVLKAPGEVLDKIRHVKFESDVTEMSLKTRESAIHRLALSLDVPQEVLTGMSGANHWSAWQIDEAAIKTHISPMMTVICDALTEAVLRPLLRAVNHPDPDSVVIWFDLSNLSQRPNRTEDAITLYDRGAISGDALRSVLGFDESDRPGELDEEARVSLLLEVLRSAPALFPTIAPMLGIELPEGTVQGPVSSRAPADPPNQGPPPEGAAAPRPPRSRLRDANGMSSKDIPRRVSVEATGRTGGSR